ncbi:MAG: hypothetical protein KAR47_17165, partial [Planctomycetes bacterium]|nr:hypothetical protein [Planctomycetota bacterium]
MIEALNRVADMWLAWELAMLWQVAALIAIVWAVDLVIRRWAWPQVRYALWLLVLVKLLLPPTLTSPTSFTAEIASVVQRIVSIQTDQDQTPQDIKPAQVYDIPAAEMPFADMGLEGAQGFSQSEFDPAPAAIEPAIPAAASAPAAVVRLSWKVYAFMVWLGGMAFLSIWLILRLSGLRREHLKSGQRMPDRFNELVAVAAKRLKLRVVPKLILTDRVCCPAVFGVFRPVLLIPAGKLSSLTREDAEHILLHELAHIKRGDLFIHAVYMMIQIAYWFNPLLWLIRRQLQNLRELCCDATVARLLKERTFSYRETLLKTARQLLAEPVDPGLGLLGLFESSNWLIERLKWLERKTWRNRRLRIATIVLLVAIMVVCVLPMAKVMSGAPAFTVKGVVIDAETGEPVAGAIVGDAGRYAEGRQSVTTDSEGSYNYKTWYEEHEIKCEAPGFKTGQKTLRTRIFGSEKEKVIDFELISEKAAEQSEFKATLPNGVTVELVGVCEHPSEGKQWWWPDGSVLRESPYDDDFGKAFPKYGEKGYKFAVKYSSMAEKEVDAKVRPANAKSTNGGALFSSSKKDGKENTKYVEDSLDEKIVWLGAAFDEELGYCDIRIGVCYGDWKSHYRHETDQPGDAVEWAEFKGVSLKPDKTWRYDLPGPDSIKFGSSSARVVDSRGKGVYGAIVEFGDELTIRDYHNNKTEKRKWNVDDTITDSVGRFPMPSIYIDLEGKTVSFDATITAEGFLDRRDVPLGEYDNGSGTIDLFRGMSVEGVVIGPDGQPLGKAPLSLSTQTLYEHPSSGCGGCYDIHMTTEEDGYFRLENVPPGLHILQYPGRSANCDDPEPLPAQNVSGAAVLKVEDGRDVEGVLIDLSESTCSVTGRIADEKGRPIEGVKAGVGVELKITSKDKDGAVVGISSTDNFPPSELTGPDGVY